MCAFAIGLGAHLESTRPALVEQSRHVSRARARGRGRSRLVPRSCASPTPTPAPVAGAGTAGTADAEAACEKVRSAIGRLAGSERGLFMTSDEDRAEIEAAVRALESCVPADYAPTANNASAAAGTWRLLYTTLTILGRRRVALAIATKRKPGLVIIGDILQIITPNSDGAGGIGGTSENVVHFDLAVGGKGKFQINATYTPSPDSDSNTKVDVKTESWVLQPEKFAEVLGDNVKLLLQIFNPQGWLDITYLDHELRVGRDHNANLFVLERVEEA